MFERFCLLPELNDVIVSEMCFDPFMEIEQKSNRHWKVTICVILSWSGLKLISLQKKIIQIQ